MIKASKLFWTDLKTFFPDTHSALAQNLSGSTFAATQEEPLLIEDGTMVVGPAYLNESEVGQRKIMMAQVLKSTSAISEPALGETAANAAETAAPPISEEERLEQEFEAKGKAALKALQEADHKKGTHLRGRMGQGNITAGVALPLWFMELQNTVSVSGEWKAEEEAAQQVLHDYITWYVERRHDGKVPSNLQVFFDYVGRSSQSDADARKQGYRGTAHFGGRLKAANWCTGASTIALFDGLEQMGYKPTRSKDDFVANLLKMRDKATGQRGMYYGTNAFAEPLQPGDVVMFLFQGCQYGGHTATVVDDLGDSFIHVSGNTGDAIGVGISESKRMKEKPSKLNLNKANDVGGLNDTPAQKAQKRALATQHIATVPFNDQVLVYSIQRYSMPFAALLELDEIDPEQNPDHFNKTLAKFHLRRIRQQ